MIDNVENVNLTFNAGGIFLRNNTYKVPEMLCLSKEKCIINPTKIKCQHVGDKVIIDTNYITQTCILCSSIYCEQDDIGNILFDTCSLEYEIVVEELQPLTWKHMFAVLSVSTTVFTVGCALGYYILKNVNNLNNLTNLLSHFS